MPFTTTHPRLSYTVEGEGPPLLLMMGFGMRGVAWRPIVERLRDRFTVVTYDNRGVGLSEDDDTVYTMADLGADGLRVAEALGWTRFHVVGVSMGGMAAQELALRAPERVRSLVLIATQPGGPGAFLPPVRTLPLLLAMTLWGRPSRRLFRRLLHPVDRIDGRGRAELDIRWQDTHAVQPRPEVRRAQLRAIRAHDTRRRLAALRVPTLVVQPTQDRLCRPAHSEALVRLLPEARLLPLDAGHGLVFHAADALADAIADHLTR